MSSFRSFTAAVALCLLPLLPSAGQAQGVDAAGLMVRVDRLENQIRTLNGQLEQMQFQIHKLEEQLRKQQQDIDFRFDELKPKAGGKPAPANAPAPAPQRRSEADTTAPLVASVDQTARPARRADVFDPSANPEAPGAPRDLGALPPGANAAPPPRASNLPTGPLADGSEVDPNAPINLAPRGTAALVPQASEAAPRAGDLQTGSLPQAAPVDHYETGMAAFKNGQFEVAEQNLRSYLDAHPKERLSPEAIFFLGESYFRRARVRDAAEQYLKVSTDFPRAPRAPESLVRLGLALEKLGAKEQACAAFGEVQRKYPAAPAPVRQSADRELKRVQC